MKCKHCNGEYGTELELESSIQTEPNFNQPLKFDKCPHCGEIVNLNVHFDSLKSQKI